MLLQVASPKGRHNKNPGCTDCTGFTGLVFFVTRNLEKGVHLKSGKYYDSKHISSIFLQQSLSLHMEAPSHSCIMGNWRFNTCCVLGRYWSIHVVQSTELGSFSRILWHHTSFQILIQYFNWNQKIFRVMITRVWLHLVSYGAPSLRRQTAARDRFTTDQQCFYANVPEWVQ